MKTKKQKNKLIEIVRSFSLKKNLGNYESADFFCSQKIECKENKAETKSEAVYEFCKQEVIKSANSYIELLRKAKEDKENEKSIKLEKLEKNYEVRDHVDAE